MSEPLPYFRRRDEPGGELFVPLAASASGWNEAHLRGPAVTALLARDAERCTGRRTDVRPARSTFDLFRPALRVPSTTASSIVREGRRLLLVDSELVQDGTVVARARTLFLGESVDPDGVLWTTDDDRRPPPTNVRTDRMGRVYRSGGAWTPDAGDHLNCRQKQVWQLPGPVVEGEAPTSYQQAAIAADMTNLAVHWGDAGVEYINADVTLALARLPCADGIGVAPTQRAADSGIAFGTATLFDRAGVFGSATVSALANAHRAVRIGTHVG